MCSFEKVKEQKEGGRKKGKKEKRKEGREGGRKDEPVLKKTQGQTNLPWLLLPGNCPPGASSDHLLAFFLEMFQAHTAPMKA